MELRKHYFLDEYVILATDRATRPHQFSHEKEDKSVKIDFFAQGNEHSTPPEIYRFPENASNQNWQIRVFPNKFPFLKAEGEPKLKTDNGFYTYGNAFGYHEVIVEHPDIKKELADLTHEELKQVLKTYQKRIKDLSKRENIKYVLVFKNKGKDAGTSIAHTHTQIAATSFIPPRIRKKEIAVSKFQKDPFEQIINNEKNSERRCFENKNMVAFTPYASRFPFEIWLMPKPFKLNITEFNDNELNDFTEILSKILNKLEEINSPYNFYLHYGIEKLRFHIEICPRLSKLAGFELGSEIIINTISPENAAKFYRDDDKELKNK